MNVPARALRRALRTLPALARVPLGAIPQPVHSRLLCGVLNRALEPELRDGALDFLEGRCVAVHVRDLGVRFHLTLGGARLRPAPHEQADLVLAGDAPEFALLASREEDPDTLFFQRRLHLDGDAELGLAVKNLLDALDLDDGRVPGALAPLAVGARRWAARLARAATPG